MRERTVVTPVTLSLHVVQTDRVWIVSVIVVLRSTAVSVVSHLTASLVLTAFVLATATSCCDITKALRNNCDE